MQYLPAANIICPTDSVFIHSYLSVNTDLYLQQSFLMGDASQAAVLIEVLPVSRDKV